MKKTSLNSQPSIWVKQYYANDYDQHGWYTTRYWVKKPSLIEFAPKPLEEMEDDEIIKIVSLYKGDEVGSERLIECKNGIVPMSF